MQEPSAQLDPRFSDPTATAVPWSGAQAVLQAAQLGWLTTVRADGSPHVTPLVPVWLNGRAHFTTGATEQKAHNLDTDPHVALTVGSATWDHGMDVVVEGLASRVSDAATLTTLAAAWAKKWDGDWHFDVVDDGFHSEEGGFARVYAIEPTRAFAFGKGGQFSQTTYRF